MNATGIPPHPRHGTTCATCVRLERFDRIAGQYPDSDGDGWPRQLVEHNAARFLLVERSTIDGGFHHSVHASPEDAAGYVDGSEYPEDWTEQGLWDLEDGTCYYPQRTTVFVPWESGHPAHLTDTGEAVR